MKPWLDEDDLKTLAGVKQRCKLEAWLNKKGIMYDFNAKGHIFSSMDLVNDALKGDTPKRRELHSV